VADDVELERDGDADSRVTRGVIHEKDAVGVALRDLPDDILQGTRGAVGGQDYDALWTRATPFHLADGDWLRRNGEAFGNEVAGQEQHGGGGAESAHVKGQVDAKRGQNEDRAAEHRVTHLALHNHPREGEPGQEHEDQVVQVLIWAQGHRSRDREGEVEPWAMGLPEQRKRDKGEEERKQDEGREATPG